MTPTDLETAARHACKLLDLDPDHWTGAAFGERWRIMAIQVREAWAIQEGIRHAQRPVLKYQPY